MHIVEAACCPSHPRQQLEAETKMTIFQDYKEQGMAWSRERKVGFHVTCFTSLYINLSNVNKTYD